MDKTSSVIRLLVKTNSFSRPNSHSSGTIFVPDPKHFLRNFIQGLLMGNFGKTPIGHSFQRVMQAIGMIGQFGRHTTAGTDSAPILWMRFIAFYFNDFTVGNVDI
jgi:hypothetical protein